MTARSHPALANAARDSATMLRRNLRHMQRYPSMSLMLIVFPVIFLLLFVYVFGGTLGAGLGHDGGRSAYANFVAPGIIVLTIAGAAIATAVSVATDMTEGIIARFRTMAIARVSVLTGHALGSVIQMVLGAAAVTAIAVATGFRPTAGILAWLAVAGLITLFALATSWLSIALGLVARSPESASNTPMPLMVLPFLGSGFVPVGSMPAGLRWFAEYQPFTPVISTVRELLAGGPVGHNAILAIAWSVAITIASYIWAGRLYNRDPVR
jgi:ABC-2 type transport system permease protein